jgi:hypothetical protein
LGGEFETIVPAAQLQGGRTTWGVALTTDWLAAASGDIRIFDLSRPEDRPARLRDLSRPESTAELLRFPGSYHEGRRLATSGQASGWTFWDVAAARAVGGKVE